MRITNFLKERKMKVEEEVKKEETNTIEESLSDLSMTDDQADEAKGGLKASLKLFLCPSDPSVHF
jgi:hypothetical protein